MGRTGMRIILAIWPYDGLAEYQYLNWKSLGDPSAVVRLQYVLNLTALTSLTKNNGR